MSNGIFVFGSNLAGRHGKGAALTAKLHHGAIEGIGFGHQGASFGIPTKNAMLRTLPLNDVAWFISKFKDYARSRPYLKFHVTRIGCGLAGFKDSDIAPMFGDAPKNCLFSSAWKKWLPTHETWTTL